MKKIITLPAFLCFLMYTGHAQLMYPEVYSSFGGYTETGTFQVTFTSGEPLFETYVAEESILTQGFNQTVQVIEEITFIEELTMDMLIYPNPASDHVIIQRESANNSDLSVRLINLQGVSSGIFRFTDSTAFIDVSGFAPGIYFLQITGLDSNTITTVKISIIK